jgi:hypothetical protein
MPKEMHMMMQPQARMTFGLNFARIGRVYQPG